MEKGTLKTSVKLNLNFTFSSGQIFRWRRFKEYWIGVSYGSLIALKQEKGELKYKIEGKMKSDELLNFLNFEANSKIDESLFYRDDLILDLYKKYNGLIILKQDKKECLLSYLTASFNNIKRASKLLESLSKISKRKLIIGDFKMYDYPSLKEIFKLDEKDFRRMGFGFRSRFFARLKNYIENEEELDELEILSMQELENKLMEIEGVGIKTANCISLYSYSKFESFPIDTWILKALKKYYWDELKDNLKDNLNINSYRKIRDYFNEKFKNNAGYAQILLYYYIKNL